VRAEKRETGAMSVSGFEIEPVGLGRARLVRGPRFGDDRGSFSVIANHDLYAALGMQTDYLQQNQSLSRDSGTVRGLHYQTPPHDQAKLVRVVRGRILDVIVDARVGSRTHGEHRAIMLDGKSRDQLFVPRGFLHGFMTLEPDTVVAYTVDNRYAPEAEFSIAWNDPELAIDWPGTEAGPTLSDKDAAGLPWSSVGETFRSLAPADVAGGEQA
jgi:dTDP-4-dehydrorhamnose 3,5-epimerase